MIPCKEYKCICFPACLGKEEIDCELLRNYFLGLVYENRGLANKTAKAWGILHSTFPTLENIPLSTGISQYMNYMRL